MPPPAPKFQLTAARRRLVYNVLGGAGGGVSTHSRPKAAGYRDLPLLIERLVSTHSRPKATGNVRVQYVNNATVSTHSRPKAAGLRRRWPKILMHCFNSQPPEGGWCGTFRFPLMRWPFQLTAARRRLGKHNAEDVDSDMVSTHSRPKAAGHFFHIYLLLQFSVSTHSRPKAAGPASCPWHYSNRCFNSQPPEGGWIPPPPNPHAQPTFQLTAARRRLAAGKLAHIKPTIVSTHSRPKAAGSGRDGN